MEESVHQNNIDNVLVKPEKNNVNAEEVEEFNYQKWLRNKVLSQISEDKLDHIWHFMFGKDYFMGCPAPYIETALKQMNRFMYYWMIELDDQTRKIILTNRLKEDDDRSVPYSFFTNSPLWKYESSVIKVMFGFFCNKCKRAYHPDFLVVHHLSYEHLGSELLHLDDVELLCMECHAKVHGKEKSDD